MRASTGLPNLERVIEVPMTRLHFLLCAALAALPVGGRAADDGPAGTIEVGSGRSEVLAKKLPVGQRIELPEGWFQVEEEGPEDGRVGSFTVVSSSEEDEGAPRAAPAAVPVPSPPAGSAAPARAVSLTPAQACRPQRSAYLRQLWKESGIDVSDPEALLEGLDAGPSGPATGYYWFALASDAFRNLSSSSDLRDRAGALVRCIQEAREAGR